jgi:hypothetical protein
MALMPDSSPITADGFHDLAFGPVSEAGYYAGRGWGLAGAAVPGREMRAGLARRCQVRVRDKGPSDAGGDRPRSGVIDALSRRCDRASAMVISSSSVAAERRCSGTCS